MKIKKKWTIQAIKPSTQKGIFILLYLYICCLCYWSNFQKRGLYVSYYAQLQFSTYNKKIIIHKLTCNHNQIHTHTIIALKYKGMIEETLIQTNKAYVYNNHHMYYIWSLKKLTIFRYKHIFMGLLFCNSLSLRHKKKQFCINIATLPGYTSSPMHV